MMMKSKELKSETHTGISFIPVLKEKSKKTETYIQKRYRTDPAFRRKNIKVASKWMKEHPERANELARIRYANRTLSQIEDRKKYLLKLREKQRNH